MHRHPRTRGTTLAELAAGSAFVAIALVGTVAAIASGSTLAKTAAETRESERVMASLMEEVRATDVDALISTYNGETRSLDGTGSSHAGTARLAVQRIDDRTTSWAVYEVLVQVQWERNGEARVLESRAYVSDRTEGSGIAEQSLVSSVATGVDDPVDDPVDPPVDDPVDPPVDDPVDPPPGNGNGNGNGNGRGKKK